MRNSLGLLFFLMMSMVSAGSVNDAVIVLDTHDQARLQRGAQIYMNYCSGCHSLQYMRYNQMGRDLGLILDNGQLNTPLLKNNLIFTTAAVHDPIHIALPPTDARQWFGVAPPDLTLIARVHTPAWIYAYLTSFYEDKSRPFGSNNLLVPDVAMPNILGPLSGNAVLLSPLGRLSNNALPALSIVNKGTLTTTEFNDLVLDLVTFLAYVAEPEQLVRYRMGKGVLLFLLIFLAFSYGLKKYYWKNLSK